MPDDVRAMTDADRIAELERKMECIVKYFDPDSPKVYSADDCHRDLTAPPPKERPKIECKEIGQLIGYCHRYYIACGTYRWTGTAWSKCGGDYAYTINDARAIAAALTAAGNYPAEYQETSR